MDTSLLDREQSRFVLSVLARAMFTDARLLDASGQAGGTLRIAVSGGPAVPELWPVGPLNRAVKEVVGARVSIEPGVEGGVPLRPGGPGDPGGIAAALRGAHEELCEVAGVHGCAEPRVVGPVAEGTHTARTVARVVVVPRSPDRVLGPRQVWGMEEGMAWASGCVVKVGTGSAFESGGRGLLPW